MTISAVIITQDEERNIGRCLQSLEGVADEIIVVDSGSTDGTERICHTHGATFVSHQWQGYSEQKNYADSLCRCDWTLSIDADEALSPALRQSIMQMRQEPPTTDKVFRVRRLTNYCGHFVRHCGWYPDAKIRLWPTGTARWEGDIHEELTFSGQPDVATLEGDLLHYSYYSVAEHARRLVKYSVMDAEKAYARGRRCKSALALWLHPAWTFLRDYIMRRGFMDGATGFTICRFNAHYTFLKYARLRELTAAHAS